MVLVSYINEQILAIWRGLIQIGVIILVYWYKCGHLSSETIIFLEVSFYKIA